MPAISGLDHTLRAAYLAVEELTGPVTLPHVVAALAAGAASGSWLAG